MAQRKKKIISLCLTERLKIELNRVLKIFRQKQICACIKRLAPSMKLTYSKAADTICCQSPGGTVWLLLRQDHL